MERNDNDRDSGMVTNHRLNPHFGGDKLNTKLGPRLDNIHSTEGSSLRVRLDPHRMHHTGLPTRFHRKDY